MMIRLAAAASLLLMATSANVHTPLFGSKEGYDFIKSMDEAMQKEKTQRDLTKRILSSARTVRQPRNLAYDDDDDGYGNGNVELDLTQFALKYVGCSAIHSWDDDVAQDADSNTVFGMERFALFRLCPAEYCGSYGKLGCQSGYGEYMITMEDYLKIMADYHFDRFLEYCETCADCMAADEAYEEAAAAYGDDDDNNNNGDDAYGYNAYGDDAYGGRGLAYNDDAYGGDDDAGDDAYGGDDDANDDGTYVSQCQYFDACQNYQIACQSYESLQYAEHEDYFECTQYKNNDNDVAYLGPHCNSDGMTISIGLYEDEYCSNYIGESVDVEEFTGIDFNDGFSEFFSSQSCVSCMSKEAFQLYGGDDDQGGNGNDVYDLCYWLYVYAGKCNIHFAELDTIQSYEQSENEEMVCAFIESLVLNTYDEYGDVIIQSESFDISKWKDIHEYQKLEQEVTALQAFLLLLSILLFMCLLIYAGYLHRKITTAPRNWNGVRHRSVSNRSPAEALSRAASGITMKRSNSSDRDQGAWA